MTLSGRMVQIAQEHREKMEVTAAISERTIADFRKMAGDAIAELDARHKQDTQVVAVLFDNLISREQQKLNEIRAELKTEIAIPPPDKKGRKRNGEATV